MPKETLNKSVEELLEVLPASILTPDAEYYRLQIEKDLECWYVRYWSDNGYDFSHHYGTLKEALEAVYNDLKTNGYL